tara:strand:- start:17110 stop:18222 length:1113 start_codon:yes stop_codon:yes gene_type:complete
MSKSEYLKILHVEGGRNLYGGALQVSYLIRGLNRKKISNVLVCCLDSDLSKISEPYSKVIKLRMLGDFDILLLFKLITIIRKEKPDIVHLHSRRIAEIIGGLSAFLSGVPSILTRRVDNRETWIIGKFKYRLYDHVVTISDAIKNILISQGVKKSRLTCVKSGVDVDLFYNRVDKNQFRKNYGFNSDTVLVGMIAQFIPRKGHLLFLEALSELKSKYDNLHALLYGKGPDVYKIRRFVAKCKLQEQVHFMGFRNDLHYHLSGLDFIVHPAEMEGLGVSLLQASASEVPIIGSRVGGIQEAVINKYNGLLINVGDKESFKQAIENLVIDVNFRKELGFNGRIHVKKKFSIKKMVDGYLDVYCRLMKSRQSS